MLLLSPSILVVALIITPLTTGQALLIGRLSLSEFPSTVPSFAVTVQVIMSPLAKAPLKLVPAPSSVPLSLVQATLELSPSPSGSSKVQLHSKVSVAIADLQSESPSSSVMDITRTSSTVGGSFEARIVTVSDPILPIPMPS